MAIPVGRLCNEKEAKKKLKYKSLCMKVQRMWNTKWMIIPVTTGATAIVTKGFRNTLEAIPGKHSIHSLQKTAILGTPHTIRKVLRSETWGLSGGNRRWLRRSTRKKRPETRDNNLIIIIIIIIIQRQTTLRFGCNADEYQRYCSLDPSRWRWGVPPKRRESRACYLS